VTGLSRNPVATCLHGGIDGPRKYRRLEQPSKLTPFVDKIKQALKADARRPRHDRRTANPLHAQIKAEGYDGEDSRRRICCVGLAVTAWGRRAWPSCRRRDWMRWWWLRLHGQGPPGHGHRRVGRHPARQASALLFHGGSG